MAKKLNAASVQEDMDAPIAHGIYLALSKLAKYQALTKVNHSWILATGMLSHLMIIIYADTCIQHVILG
jgi:hypothetical protein